MIEEAPGKPQHRPLGTDQQAAPPHHSAGRSKQRPYHSQLSIYVSQVAALVGKDLRLESRRRETIAGVLVFVLLVLTLFLFALDMGPGEARRLAPGVLWITLLFAGLLALGRTFAAERDQGTLDGLLLAPLDRSALYLAKVAATVAFMALVEIIALPVFAAVFDAPLLAPLLIAAARATDDLLAGAATPTSAPWWELLLGLTALFLGAAVLLFDSLVEE